MANALGFWVVRGIYILKDLQQPWFGASNFTGLDRSNTKAKMVFTVSLAHRRSYFCNVLVLYARLQMYIYVSAYGFTFLHGENGFWDLCRDIVFVSSSGLVLLYCFFFFVLDVGFDSVWWDVCERIWCNGRWELVGFSVFHSLE